MARRHSLSRNLIRLWNEADEFTDELAKAVYVAEYERKMAELERKVGQLTMEVDLLKKRAEGIPGRRQIRQPGRSHNDHALTAKRD